MQAAGMSERDAEYYARMVEKHGSLEAYDAYIAERVARFVKHHPPYGPNTCTENTCPCRGKYPVQLELPLQQPATPEPKK